MTIIATDFAIISTRGRYRVIRWNVRELRAKRAKAPVRMDNLGGTRGSGRHLISPNDGEPALDESVNDKKRPGDRRWRKREQERNQSRTG